MASVQELIAAADAKAGESPLIGLAKALAGGVQSYQAAKEDALNQQVKQVQVAQLVDQADRNKKILDELKSKIGGTTPLLPGQKMEETYTQNKEGVSKTIKIVDDKQKSDLLFTSSQLKAIRSGKTEDLEKAFPEGIPPRAVELANSSVKGMSSIDFSQASPQDQQLAKALQEGRVRPSDIGFRDRGRIVGLAQDYATRSGLPFESYSGDIKAGMSKNLAYGKLGQNALSFNTALGHIGDASKAYEDIQNTNQKWLNVPINKLKRETNDPNITALDVNLNAVAGELATVFKGSSGTDQEIGHWADVLRSDLTPAQAQAALKKASELLNSRLSAINYQQSSVLKGTNERDIVSPHGKDVMKKLEGNSNPSPGMVRFTASDGSVHDIPKENLEKAKKRDPGLKVS